jgi:phage N-6-adenine-methyltransferase
MATVSNRLRFNGHPDLGRDVDVDTWLTPRWILDRLGAFDLDPCAALECRDWVCPESFTKADDGLEREWRGRVFMNPPFSQTARWLERHAIHANGISLVPSTVEAAVWRSHVWPKARAIFLFFGRTRFCNPDGSTTTGRPLRSIALIAWSAHDADVIARAGFAGVLLDSWRSMKRAHIATVQSRPTLQEPRESSEGDQDKNASGKTRNSNRTRSLSE